MRIPNDAVTVIEEPHCKMPLPFGEKAQCSKDPLVRKPAWTEGEIGSRTEQLIWVYSNWAMPDFLKFRACCVHCMKQAFCMPNRNNCMTIAQMPVVSSETGLRRFTNRPPQLPIFPTWQTEELDCRMGSVV